MTIQLSCPARSRKNCRKLASAASGSAIHDSSRDGITLWIQVSRAVVMAFTRIL